MSSASEFYERSLRESPAASLRQALAALPHSTIRRFVWALHAGKTLAGSNGSELSSLVDVGALADALAQLSEASEAHRKAVSRVAQLLRPTMDQELEPDLELEALVRMRIPMDLARAETLSAVLERGGLSPSDVALFTSALRSVRARLYAFLPTSEQKRFARPPNRLDSDPADAENESRAAERILDLERELPERTT